MGIIVRKTEAQSIILNGTSVALNEVYVRIEVILPLAKNLLIFNPIVYFGKSFYEENVTNRLKTSIPIKFSQGVNGILAIIKEGEAPTVETALLKAKEYFESLGYVAEIEE